MQGINYKCSPKYRQPVEAGTPNKKARTLAYKSLKITVNPEIPNTCARPGRYLPSQEREDLISKREIMKD